MDLDTPIKAQYRLLSIGDTLVDEFWKIPDEEGEVKCELDQKKEVVCFPYGKKIYSSGVDYSVGGNAANIAVGIGRLGIRSLLVSTIGDDWTSKMILDSMAGEGIGTFLIQTQKQTAGARGVVVNYHGERTLFGYHPEYVYQVPQEFPAVEWIYLTSMGVGYQQMYGAAVGWKKKTGAKLAFNPGTRQLLDGADRWREVLEVCDLLLINKAEAEAILGGREAEPKELLGRLTDLGPKAAVVTDGAAGAFATDGSRKLWSSIYEVPVVETTGAGDGFGVGFLAAMMERRTIDESLKWGMVESASVISQVGAEKGLLTRAELEERLEKAETVIVREI